MNKNKEVIFPSDEMRTPINLASRDSRLSAYPGLTIESMYDAMNQFELSEAVEEKIRVQYDTARNLFLHSYFVYRFFNVAESQLFSVLELALKEVIEQKHLSAFKKTTKGKKFRSGLRLYLEFISINKIIRNEDFPAWHNRNWVAARNDYDEKVFKIMEEQGLDEYQMDSSEIDETQYDVELNYVEILCELIPKQRNEYAHG